MNLIKQYKVEKKLDVSRSTLIRLWLRGEFPAPRKIGHNNFWVEQEVDDWILARFGFETGAEGMSGLQRVAAELKAELKKRSAQ